VTAADPRARSSSTATASSRCARDQRRDVQTAERRTSSQSTSTQAAAASASKASTDSSHISPIRTMYKQHTDTQTGNEKEDRELEHLSTQQAQRSLKARRARWVSWALHPSSRPVDLRHPLTCCSAVINCLPPLPQGPTHPAEKSNDF
jgi:hypothetical protein